MTLPPVPADIAAARLMNPVTAALLASVSRNRPEDNPVGDLLALARMVRDGDLVHIDALAAVAEAHGFRLVPMPCVVGPVRTAEAVFDAAAYDRSRGGC